MNNNVEVTYGQVAKTLEFQRKVLDYVANGLEMTGNFD